MHQKSIDFTHMKIYNETHEGRLNGDLMATSLINELKGKPPPRVPSNKYPGPRHPTSLFLQNHHPHRRGT